MQKGLKAFVLIIIFGVPVFWYLFLQLFGTNEFELPTLGKAEDDCIPTELTVQIIRAPISTEARNQSNRIEQNQLTKALISKDNQGCSFEAWDLILVAPTGDIKGAYLWEIADIDRLITEVELYYTIAERNGTSDSK
ncbi:MAG: hypothetical protein R8G66_07485 [Cytophagales bacterium]|nr:hypothetical protein [Cytophagales bacterium]